MKHPDTPRTVFMNVFEYDRVRRVLSGRCAVCGYVLSQDEKAVREIMFDCGQPKCTCRHYIGGRVHGICNLCYEMHHALYANVKLSNMNYFKEIDEKEKKDRSDTNRRDKLGL